MWPESVKMRIFGVFVDLLNWSRVLFYVSLENKNIYQQWACEYEIYKKNARFVKDYLVLAN